MTKYIKFYQTNQGRWFADIPEWEGDIEELEMVMGADSMLNILADMFANEVYLTLSTESLENATILTLTEHTPSIGGGYYIFDQYMGITYGFKIWLCDVTKFVFGEMPEKIYILKNS